MQNRFLPFTLTFLLALAASAKEKVAIIADAAPNSPAGHGIEVLRAAIRAKNLEAVTSPEGADYFVFAGDSRAMSRAPVSKGRAVTVPQVPESFSVFPGRTSGKPAVVIAGSDTRGVMYAALDTAERITRSKGTDLFEDVQQRSETPYLQVRGVSTYTMQRAYFEARLYDERYWTRYFDLLAKSRINSYVLILG
jgi:hypothetical protein